MTNLENHLVKQFTDNYVSDNVRLYKQKYVNMVNAWSNTLNSKRKYTLLKDVGHLWLAYIW